VKPLLAFLPSVLAAALVLYVNGTLSGFAVWNLLPIGLGALVLGMAARGAGPRSSAFRYFAVVATFIPLLAHLAWVFDWGGTATGSSTSALIFIFLPAWAIAIGAAAGILRWAIARVQTANGPPK
jgi:hypothetical protein